MPERLDILEGRKARRAARYSGQVKVDVDLHGVRAQAAASPVAACSIPCSARMSLANRGSAFPQRAATCPSAGVQAIEVLGREDLHGPGNALAKCL
jgi:hypothetical protein